MSNVNEKEIAAPADESVLSDREDLMEAARIEQNNENASGKAEQKAVLQNPDLTNTKDKDVPITGEVGNVLEIGEGNPYPQNASEKNDVLEAEGKPSATKQQRNESTTIGDNGMPGEVAGAETNVPLVNAAEPPLPLPSLARAPPVVRQQRPGAYNSGPGVELSRNDNVNFSRVGNSGDNDIETNVPDQEAPLPPSHDGHQLVEANMVMDAATDANITRAIPVDLEARQQQKRERLRKTWLMVAVITLVCIVTAVIGGSVVATHNNSSPILVVPTNTTNNNNANNITPMSPTGAPSSASTGVLDRLMIDLPNYTQESILQYGTPQNLAWEWLSNHPDLVAMPNWRRKQLFSLATIYHAFGGSKWRRYIQDRWLDYEQNECLWFSSSFGFFNDGVFYPFDEREFDDESLTEYYSDLVNICNANGEYTQLDMTTFFPPDTADSQSIKTSIPSEVTLLTSLEEIALGGSLYINGTLSHVLPFEQMPQIKNLTRFVVTDSSLHGPIPTELGLLTSLRELRFNDNTVSGVLPTELGLLSNLRSLTLSRTFVSGRLPSELGELHSLVSLIMDSNYLSGPIPTELGLMAFASISDDEPSTRRTQASISSGAPANMTAGMIMMVPGTAVMIPTNVTVSANATAANSMTVPENVTVVTGLMVPANATVVTAQMVPANVTPVAGLMMVPGTSFGSIPSELVTVDELRVLNLRDNSLSGAIPSELALLTSLIEVRLGDNSLSGAIPSELPIDKLWILEINGNDGLHGTIPDYVCTLMDDSCLYFELWNFSCVLDFDCTDILCGCDCPCTNSSLVGY